MSNHLKKTNYYQSANEIIELVNSFERCTFPVSDWNQEFYLTIVFWYCYLNPPAEAKRLLKTAVRRYIFENNQKFFDESVMLKNLNLVQNFLNLNSKRYSFVECVNKLIENIDDNNWMAKLYAGQILIAAKENVLGQISGNVEKKYRKLM